MNEDHVLFWEVFLSICSLCLAIALGSHFWFLRKKTGVRKEKGGRSRTLKRKKSIPRKKGSGKRRK